MRNSVQGVADRDVVSRPVGEPLLIIGRQVATSSGKVIDLLAADADGVLHVLELKKDKTPREVVAQVLDYGS
jgi:RecB family endonuclease NucS